MTIGLVITIKQIVTEDFHPRLGRYEYKFH
jgi:hypothetical protein